MEPVRLYHLAPSHYCEKARKILEYKDIPFETVNVPYGNHQEVLRASGQDYVPYVEVPGSDGVRWPDIADWAEGAKPEPTIYPDGSRALCHVLDQWAHEVVEVAVWPYAAPDVPKRLGSDQERWVFTEMQELKRGPLERLRARRPELLEGMRRVCRLAEDLLDGKPYLLGDAPSLADFALYGALHPLPFTGHDLPDGFDKLRTWHARVVGL